MAQQLGQSAFFYYNPDPSPENNRQHGHFTPHPHGLPMPAGQTLLSEPLPLYNASMGYVRPNSSCSQASYAAKSGYTSQSLLTPIASPQPLGHKPTILVQQQDLFPLDTDCSEMRFAPSTPTLSSSGSTISSPPSTCEFLPTPVNGAFYSLELLEGVKEGCEGEVLSEILGGEFTRSASPPMTPGKQTFAVMSLGHGLRGRGRGRGRAGALR